MKGPQTVQATFDVQRQIGRRCVGLGWVRPHQREELADHPELCERIRPRDRRAAQPGRHPRRLVRHQRADDEIQRVRGERQPAPVPWPGHWRCTTRCRKAGRNKAATWLATSTARIGDSAYNKTQDFFDPVLRGRLLAADRRGPSSRHRHGRLRTPVVEQIAATCSEACSADGSCPASSISDRGEPLRITQASGIANSRPDYNGGNQVFDDWRDTLQYLDRSAYTLVPTYLGTGATVRPGNQNSSQVHGPGRRRVDLTIAKTFTLRGTSQLQFRFESFNVVQLAAIQQPGHERHRAEFRPDHQRGVDENRADRIAADVLAGSP